MEMTIEAESRTKTAIEDLERQLAYARELAEYWRCLAMGEATPSLPDGYMTDGKFVKDAIELHRVADAPDGAYVEVVAVWRSPAVLRVSRDERGRLKTEQVGGASLAYIPFTEQRQRGSKPRNPRG